MKAATGFSYNANAYEAGKEAILKAKSSLSDPKIAFLYASADYDLNALLKGAKENLNCPIIGNTSFTGSIIPDGYISGANGFVTVMLIEDKDLVVGVGECAKTETNCARTAGKNAAEKALKMAGKTSAPDYMYMAASPTEEESYLKGISELVGRVPLFGGSAADNAIEGKWNLYTSENITNEGVACAFFYSKKPIANCFTGAYHETSDCGVITKIEGKRKLVEICGEPALTKYAEWRKLDQNDLMGMNLLVATISSPLGVKDPLGDLIAIRHPMAGNSDLSMSIGSNLSVGTAVIRMEATIDELITSVGETLDAVDKKLGKPVAFYHLVHCGGRRAGIADRIEEVYEQVKNKIGNTPFIMEFTFGEYGYEDDGRNTCGGLMLSFTAFAE